jgi:hypothetical protein
MELTTSSTPSFGSGAATTVSSSSTRVARTRGGGGVLHEGWGLVGAVFKWLGFFGQFLDSLFAKETSPFCHKSSLLFLTQGVLGVNGVYVHHIWVARGGTSSLSMLSKAMLPLIPRSQVPLVSH